MKKLLLVFVCTVFFARFLYGAQVDTPAPDKKHLNQNIKAPFSVADSLFDFAKPDTLGLQFPEKIKTVNVFSATDKTNKYNHGAVLIPFKGKLYIQWQSSAVDEDAPDTQVYYSTTTNTEEWTAPQILVVQRDNAVVTNGGWWTDGKTLVAYINVWPTTVTPRGGYVEYITSVDGDNWSEPKRLIGSDDLEINGIIEQDLRALPSGRILTAIHRQPGLIAKPAFTDDPLGISGWQFGELTNLPHQPEISRELEPSWFLTKDNSVVMIFRDQGGSFRVLASVSRDNGQTWSQPLQTPLYDSRSKQSAGNLPNGTAFIVNNPSGSKTRIPLTMTLSSDGVLFNRAFLLRGGAEVPAMKFEGKYKRLGYSYPKSIVWQDNVYVSYAVNKEDIAVTRIPVASLINQ